GVSVTFTAPAGSAGGTFPGGQDSVTVITDAKGCATAAAFTSNATAGSYMITAQAAGLMTMVEFQLANVYRIDTLDNADKDKECGSTIPLRLEVTDVAGNNVGSTALPVQALSVVDRNGNQIALQSPGNANPHNLFQYDPRAGIYQFNLKTTG